MESNRVRSSILGLTMFVMLFAVSPYATAECLCERIVPARLACNTGSCQSTIVVNEFVPFDFSSCLSSIQVVGALRCCGQPIDNFEYWNACKINSAQNDFKIEENKSIYWSKNYYVPSCTDGYEAVL